MKLSIGGNAAEAARLHGRIHETLAKKDVSPEKREEWKQACELFHRQYVELAFPRGYDTALDRLAVGDEQTMEATICFLEMRPYFFRSGYMFDALLLGAKHAPLSPEQGARLQVVVAEVKAWKVSKSKK